MLKRLATLLCCCLPLVVSAAQVTDLYQGKAPTSGDMTAAQSQALGEVLVKVTGKRDILTQPDVVKALAAPADYVQQYSYQDIGSVKFLKADFNVAKVNALVGQAAGDRFENLLGHQRPVEWALRPDRRGLGGGHAGGAEQRPQALLTGQRTDLALDAGSQAQALTGKTEAARHDGGPREVWLSAYTRAPHGGR